MDPPGTGRHPDAGSPGAAGAHRTGRDPDDRRMSVATITRDGLALLERIAPELETLQSEMTAPLGEAQLRQLARLCDALIP